MVLAGVARFNGEMGIHWGPLRGPKPPSTPACPLCESTDVEFVGRARTTGLRWYLCRACGYVWTLIH